MTTAMDPADAPVSETRPATRGPRRRLPVVLGQAVVVAIIAQALALFRFRFWEQSYSALFVSRNTDSLQMGAVIRSINDSGWYFTNSHVGAPFGQQLYDVPLSGESIQILVLKFLTLFSDRPFWVMNVYFLIGFPAVAFVTFLVLTHLRFRFLVAASIALLYTWLPYHFMRGQSHMFRSAYLSAPLAILVTFWVLSWKDRFLVDPVGPVWGVRRLWGNLRRGRVMGAIALCVFIGAFETMVMSFALIALVFSALIAALRNRDVGDLVAALLAGVVIAGTFGVMFAPNYLYKARNGPNDTASARVPAEQVIYGLQIAKMVLPVADHHVEALGNMEPRAQERNPTPGEAGQNLGLLGALGLLALLYGVIVNRLDTRSGRDPTDRHRLWVQSGLITIVLILFGTMAGFALILSLLGFSQIRTWDRVVILIAFCALLMVAIALEDLLVRLRRFVHDRVRSDRPSSRKAVAAVLSVILVAAVTAFGMWDTETGYASSVTNAKEDARAQMLTGFDRAIAQRIGQDGMIFQLPVVRYPETPPLRNLDDYEEFLPYLYAPDLRFSYGATKGRPDADWQLQIDSNYPGKWLAGLRGMGFDGILVDINGYADNGVGVTKRLTAQLGPPAVVSPDYRWRFWDLRSIGERKGLSDAELREAAVRMIGPGMMARIEADD